MWERRRGERTYGVEDDEHRGACYDGGDDEDREEDRVDERWAEVSVGRARRGGAHAPDSTMTEMTPMKRTPETEWPFTLRWMVHIFHAIVTGWLSVRERRGWGSAYASRRGSGRA